MSFATYPTTVIAVVMLVVFSLSAAEAQPARVADSLALVALYDSTDGANWLRSEGWLSGQPIGEWHGVSTVSVTTDTVTLQVVSGIVLSANGLSGTLPSIRLPQLEVLDLSANALRDTLPFMDLPALKKLDLSRNSLQGELPDLIMPLLEELNLRSNDLSGELPTLTMPRLKRLILWNNRFNRALPAFDLPNLEVLNLENNGISRRLPLMNLPRLRVLNLRSNLLVGPLPELAFPDLELLYLEDNQIGGPIPMLNLPQLRELGLRGNELSGAVPVLTLPRLRRLSLGVNRLSEWPPQNGLDSLEVLDIDRNRLSFEDFEPNMSFGAGLSEFSYIPQDTLLPLVANVAPDSALLRVIGPGSANRYQWYRDSVAIVGANQAVYVAHTEGNFHCVVTNAVVSGLELTSETVFVDLAPVSVREEAQKQWQPGIHPNPCSNEAVLHFRLDTAETLDIALFTSLGRRHTLVEGRYFTAGEHAIPLSGYLTESGVYTVVLRSGKKSHSVQVVKID